MRIFRIQKSCSCSFGDDDEHNGNFCAHFFAMIDKSPTTFAFFQNRSQWSDCPKKKEHCFKKIVRRRPPRSIPLFHTSHGRPLSPASGGHRCLPSTRSGTRAGTGGGQLRLLETGLCSTVLGEGGLSRTGSRSFRTQCAQLRHSGRTRCCGRCSHHRDALHEGSHMDRALLLRRGQIVGGGDFVCMVEMI